MLTREHYSLRALVSNMVKFSPQNKLPPKCYEHSDGYQSTAFQGD